MPVRGNTFKIFVGNLSDRASGADIRELFEQHGTVVEADVVKNYGFVHMEKEDEGQAAIEALNAHSLHGKPMVVEASTGARKGNNQKTKIFVGNLHKETKLEELKSLFEVYGSVVESDILTNYAFMHMDDEAQAQRAIRELDGYEIHGLRLRVQESTSRVRQNAGMGNPDMCYRCGSGGHWSKECPRDGRLMGRFPERGGAERGRFGSSSRYDPYPPPPPPSYARERMMRYRDEFERFDRYDRYYEDSLYERRYGDHPPPPPPMMDDLYERRLPPLPPPPHPDYLRYGRRSPPPRSIERSSERDVGSSSGGGRLRLRSSYAVSDLYSRPKYPTTLSYPPPPTMRGFSDVHDRISRPNLYNDDADRSYSYGPPERRPY